MEKKIIHILYAAVRNAENTSLKSHYIRKRLFGWIDDETMMELILIERNVV